MLSDDLNDFETRIRERQLDDVIQAGPVTAAEILQPYVRKAQSAGVLITVVPSFDAASIELDAATARQLKRCVAGFVANALNAGATQLGFALHTSDREVVLEVTDDAGGFQLSDAPAGRGLWLLRADLGEGNLRSEPHGSGTTMIASLTLGATT